MATNFTPEADLPEAKGFLNYSQGFRDNAAGTALSEVAGTLDTGLKAIDRGVAQMANDDVRTAVAETDAEVFGITNAKGPAKDPLSDEVKSQVQNLASKKLAMDSGTIDPDHYYATVMAKVKNIRARYSGYQEQIDDDLKSIGIDPNWQRHEIIREGIRAQNAKATAAAEYDKDQREWSESVLKDPRFGISKETRQAFLDDPFAWRNPKAMKALKADVAKSAYILGSVNMKKAQLEALDVKDKTDARRIAETYDHETGVIVRNSLVSSGAQEALDIARANARKDIQETGKLSPEHSDQLRIAFANYKTQFQALRAKISADPLYSDNMRLFADEKKKIDENWDKVIDDLGNNLTDKEYGVFSFNANGVKARVENEELGLTSDRLLAIGAAGRSLYGDKYWDNLNGDFRKAFINHLDGFALGEASVDRAQLGTSVYENQKKFRDYKINKPEVNKANFESSINTLLSPEARDDAKFGNAKALFGEANQPFWDNIWKNPNLTQEQKLAYMRKMTSPVMAKEIDRLSKLDPSIKTQYNKYVAYMFTTLADPQTVSTVNDMITNASNYTVKYNETTHHLDIAPYDNPTKSVIRLGLQAAQEDMNWKSWKAAVDRINAGIDALMPAWEHDGINPDEVVPRLITQKLGIQVGKEKTGFDTGESNFDRGMKSVGTFISDSVKSTLGVLNSPPDALGREVLDYLNNPKNIDNSPIRFLGGPGMEHEGSSTPTQAPSTAEVRKGQLAEIKELNKMIAETDDPQFKQELIKERAAAMEEYRTGRVGGAKPENMNTKSGEPEPGLGNPDTSIFDFFTSIPSLKEAIQSGDPTEIGKQVLMAVASIIPFPGVKQGAKVALKEGEKALEGGAKIISNTTREAKGVEKALAKSDQMIKELDNINPSSLSDEKIEKIMNTIDATIDSKGITKEQKISLNKKWSQLKAEQLDRASSIASTPGMKKLENYREGVVRNKINDIEEEHIAKLARNMTPEEVGKEIDKFKKFRDFSNDDALIAGYNKEIDLLERVQKVMKNDKKVIEGGAENAGKSNASLRPVDEPGPKGLSADVPGYKMTLDDLPKTKSNWANEQRAALVERGIATPEQLNHYIQKKGAKYLIVENHTQKIVDSATNLKSAMRKVDNRDLKYGAHNYGHYKIDD